MEKDEVTLRPKEKDLLFEAKRVNAELEQGIATLARVTGLSEQEIRDRLADLTGNPRTRKSVAELFAEAFSTRHLEA